LILIICSSGNHTAGVLVQQVRETNFSVRFLIS